MLATLTSVIHGFLKSLSKIWLFFAQAIGSLTLLIVLGVFAVLLFAGKTDTRQDQVEISEKVITTGDASKKIVILPLTGEIVSSSLESSGFSLSTNAVASDQLVPLLKQIAADEKVKAVVFHLNSPGGAVVATDEIYRAALALSAKKPIITVFRDVAASGGYYLSMASKKIVANPATITGSIGVITQSTELSGLYSKLGVEVRTFKSGEFKDIGSPARKMTDAESEIIQAIISDSYDQFVEAVSLGRNWDVNHTREIADGRVVSGKEALRLGLIDELGGLDRGVELAKQLADVSDGEVVEYQLGGWFESLLSGRAKQLPLANMLFGTSATLTRPTGLYYLWQ